MSDIYILYTAWITAYYFKLSFMSYKYKSFIATLQSAYILSAYCNGHIAAMIMLVNYILWDFISFKVIAWPCSSSYILMKG